LSPRLYSSTYNIEFAKFHQLHDEKILSLQHDNNNLVRRLDMNVHENQLSNHSIQVQEHDLMGLTRALKEKEKVCFMTKEKIEKYTSDSMQYAHERDIIGNDLLVYRSEAENRSDVMKSNFYGRSGTLQGKANKFMDRIGQLGAELKNHLDKSQFEVQQLHEANDRNINETKLK